MNFQQAFKPLFYFALIALGLLLGIFLKPSQSVFSGGDSNKVSRVLGILQNKYVDTINTEQLEESAIEGMLNKLDPHSSYIPARELQDVNEQLQGNFYGIGVEFNILRDTVTVLNVIQGGPASKGGILSGDKIVKVENEVFTGKPLTSSDVRKKLKGPKDTKVKLGIWRESRHSYFQVTLTRDEIPLHSVNASGFIDSQTGYIRITRFADNTYEEFRSALKDLIGKGMKSLVIDLRGNPGGFMNAATQIVDELLEENKKIVYTRRNVQDNGKPGEVTRNEVYSKEGGLFETGKVYVFIDEHSASASEILAGALQDWDRGIIIGRRSFGKGLVQDQVSLGDGSAFRVTIARYYTPSGRCIQKPYQQGPGAYENELRERRLNKGDTVLSKEIYKTSKGRIVYGGGGIYPDVQVRLDTSWYHSVLTSIFESGKAQEYIISKQEELQAFKKMEVSEILKNAAFLKIIEGFKKYITVTEPKYNQMPATSQKYMERQLMAQAGTLIGGEKMYYMILMLSDQPFLEGLNKAKGMKLF